MADGSIIGRGSVVRGNVHGEGSLEILGRVEGDVTMSGDVALGEEAVVRGNIVGGQVSIAGTVQGNLRGEEAVLIETGARVVGDLSAPRIGIASGALVRGTVRTDGEAPLVQPQPQRRPIAAAPAQSARSAPASLRAAPAPRPEPARPAPAIERPAPAVERPAQERVPVERYEEPESPRRARAEPPPPVVPVLAKNAKAKKKKREG